MARLLYVMLEERGYSVFYDRESLRTGRFDESIKVAIKQCDDFILILSPEMFDGRKPENDEVLKEVIWARECGKMPLPLQMPGFEFPGAGYKFPDMTTENLAWQLKDDGVTVLMVAKGASLDLVENEDIFRIPAPFRPAELVGAVKMLVQLDQQRFKPSAARRTDDEKQMIADAKQLLMDREGYTEDQAHRYLQRRSMETSLKMTEVARLIIASYE